jgi:hypothetical protein
MSADETAITALLYRYARGVDTKDWDLYRSVFTDDAVIEADVAGDVLQPDPAARQGRIELLRRLLLPRPPAHGRRLAQPHLREEAVWSVNGPTSRE